MMQSSVGKEIQFIRRLPEFKEYLREIDPKFYNVLVFDDLMALKDTLLRQTFPS